MNMFLLRSVIVFPFITIQFEKSGILKLLKIVSDSTEILRSYYL